MTLNATSVGVGRRDRFFLCMCSRSVFFLLLVLIFLLLVLMVMYQNRQVMVTSFTCFWFSGGASLSPDCWGGQDGGWPVIAISLLKMYVRMACEIWVGS